jgi:NAD(P)H-hydrate epimerase
MTKQGNFPLPRLPNRLPDSHKGDYGRGLLIGGSRGMTGAIALAGVAALRGGAGLVKLVVPDACQDTVASYEPSYMTVGVGSDAVGRLTSGAQAAIGPLAEQATALAVGPGLGRSADLDRLVGWMYQQLTQPMVVDADALNSLSDRRDGPDQAGGPRILTPHPGEFARLLGKQGLSVEEQTALAVDLAGRCGVVVVLKGHRTLVTDGTQQWTNTTGNPGMATGGSGDVLTGVITALLCQGLSPWDAARLGVHVHGLAGDLAAAELGPVGLIASDLLKSLPAAFKGL